MYLVSDPLPFKAALTLSLLRFPDHPKSGMRLLVSLKPGDTEEPLWELDKTAVNDTQQLSVSQPHCGGCCEHFTFHFIAADQILVFTARMCAI